MDLLEKLKEIFKGGDMNRLTDIEEVLIKEAISMPSDFEYLNEEMLVKMNYFKPVEIKKILKAKEKLAKSLKNALEEIFENISSEKLKNIETFFEEEDIYTTEHLVMFIVNQADRCNDIFSDLDMEKITKYIRKNYPEKFKEVKGRENCDKNLDLLKCLNEEKLILLDIQKESNEALVKFVITQGICHSLSCLSKSQLGRTLCTLIGQKCLKLIFGSLMTVTVVSEITNMVSTIYAIKEYANNKQMIRDDLKLVQDRLIEIELKINEANAGGDNQNYLTSDTKTLSIEDKK